MLFPLNGPRNFFFDMNTSFFLGFCCFSSGQTKGQIIGYGKTQAQLENEARAQKKTLKEKSLQRAQTHFWSLCIAKEGKHLDCISDLISAWATPITDRPNNINTHGYRSNKRREKKMANRSASHI